MGAEAQKKIAELRKKTEERRERRDTAEETQLAIDLQARFDLEEEHGEEAIAAVKMPRFKEGMPTFALVKAPTQSQYKRYKDQVNKNVIDKKSGAGVINAQEMLAKSCWIYPKEQDEQQLLLDAFAGLLTPLCQAACALAEGVAEQEGKD